MGWRGHTGAYQMDATTADIYLVSRLDRTKVVGRPYVYLAVDTATQLIAGLYVGYDAGEETVMACLSNAAMDKVEYCRRFGIDIDAADWPSVGLPSEVITDQGRDFTGGRMQELCAHYGITCETLPPFRPDRKGLVEKMFDLMQSRYKPVLRGQGIIEEDAQERWAVDYRTQASLDLTQFTQVLIHCILYLNGRRVLGNYQMSRDMRERNTPPTAAGLWRYYADSGKTSLMKISANEIYYMCLPRTTGKLTRRGISHNHFHYINREFMLSDKGQRHIGQKVTFACDEQSVQKIYMVENGAYIPFELAPQFSIYGGVTRAESNLYWKDDRNRKRDYKEQEAEGRVMLIDALSAIKKEAKPEEKGSQDGKDIKMNRTQERDRRK
jgi:preprotein translocase subunit Sec61beta